MPWDPQYEELFGERLSRCGQSGYAQLANPGLPKEEGGVRGDRERFGEDTVVDGWDIGDLKGISIASTKASEGKRRREFGDGDGDGDADREPSLLLSSEPISSA